jgi:hypothetical protein
MNEGTCRGKEEEKGKRKELGRERSCLCYIGNDENDYVIDSRLVNSSSIFFELLLLMFSSSFSAN